MSFRGWQKVTINTPNSTVEGIAPVIISASRATDIPAFYADWFMHSNSQGTFEQCIKPKYTVKSPYDLLIEE